MTAAPLLERLTRVGVNVVAEGDRLHIQAPKGALTAADRAALAAHKASLLRLLGPLASDWRVEVAGWPDWAQDLYEERAAIREFDGNQTRDDAERGAYLEIREQLLAHNPCPQCAEAWDALACSCCGYPSADFRPPAE